MTVQLLPEKTHEEKSQELLKMSLGGHAEDFMVRDVITVPPDMNAYDAIALLLKHRISGMPVVDGDNRVIGVLSERDCLKTLVNAKYHNLPTALVKDLMSTEVTTIGPKTDILDIAKMFLENRYRRLPVVLEDGTLAGQVSRHDLLKAVEKR